MMCRSWFLVLLLVIASCDSQTTEDTSEACPPDLGDGETNYYPLLVGTRWIYDYKSADLGRSPSSNGEKREFGVATWEVLSEGACSYGSREYVISELIEGRVEWWLHTPDYDSLGWQDQGPVRREKEFTAWLSDSLRIETFAVVIPWKSASRQDTLTITQTRWADFVHIDFAVRLVPDVGPVYWKRYHKTNHGDWWVEMRLREKMDP